VGKATFGLERTPPSVKGGQHDKKKDQQKFRGCLREAAFREKVSIWNEEGDENCAKGSKGGDRSTALTGGKTCPS